MGARLCPAKWHRLVNQAGTYTFIFGSTRAEIFRFSWVSTGKSVATQVEGGLVSVWERPSKMKGLKLVA